MSFTLQIGGGAPQTFAALGIAAASVTDDAAGQSSLQLDADHLISDPSIIAPFQKVVLRADGVVRFVGWMDTAPHVARGTSERVVYRLAGPHRWLARATFTQSRAGLALLGGSAGDGLNQDPAPISEAITEVLTAALSKYPGAFAYTGVNTFEHQIPIERRVDVKCWQALRALLGYAPTAVLWWTYGSGGDETKPVLHIADGDRPADQILSNETHEISEAQLDPKYDLLADTVTVYYVKDGVLSDPQTAGPGGDAQTLDANQEIVFTFDAGSLYNVPANGLAAALAKWHQTLHIDGTANRLSIDWNEVPGYVVGFGGEFSKFSGYTSLVYSLTRDLFNESTSLALGIMPGKDMIPISQRADDTNSSEIQSGGGGSPPEDPTAGSGHPLQLLDASTDTGNKVRIVYGTVGGWVPSGMSLGDDPAYVLVASGTKIVYVIVTISSTTGDITSVTLSQGVSVPDDEATTFHQQLGSYTISSGKVVVAQAVTGSLAFTACRDFMSNPPVWRAIWGNL